MVSGIIIDSFASQRQMTEAIDEDVKGKCFICNIEREDFEAVSSPD